MIFVCHWKNFAWILEKDLGEIIIFKIAMFYNYVYRAQKFFTLHFLLKFKFLKSN
jgi:hypothetical protein